MNGALDKPSRMMNPSSMRMMGSDWLTDGGHRTVVDTSAMSDHATLLEILSVIERALTAVSTMAALGREFRQSTLSQRSP
jgi:hypothetical protein